MRILKGQSCQVAAGMRRSATKRGLSKEKRKAMDACARYLLNNGRYLHYGEPLAAGMPIATGVIEGACRRLVKDRMDLTGARWSVQGAESVLKIRALRSCGDFELYWHFHKKQEYKRNHESRYAKERSSQAAGRSVPERSCTLFKKELLRFFGDIEQRSSVDSIENAFRTHLGVELAGAVEGFENNPYPQTVRAFFCSEPDPAAGNDVGEWRFSSSMGCDEENVVTLFDEEGIP